MSVNNNSNSSIDETLNTSTDEILDSKPEIEDFKILTDFPEMKKRNKLIIDVILITLFSALAFTLGMIYLSDHITAGVDGGYYELQTGNFVDYGELFYKTPVLLFLFTALFTVISGSTTFGVTFSASLFFAAAVVSNYFAAKITWNRKVATITLPFSALSVILFRLSTDFMKNLLALVFVPLAIACFSRYHLKREWKYFTLSIVFSVLTMSTHLMTSLTLAVCLVGYYVIFHIITSLEDWKVDWKRLLFSSILLLAIAAGMGLIWVFNEYAIPVKETYWNYSSNALPDGDSTSYTPGEEGYILPLVSIFRELPTLESILLIFGLVFVIATLVAKPSKKERTAIIMLVSMLFPIWLLAISIDVDGWLQRMCQDLACFLILASAFTISYAVRGLECLVKWVEKKSPKIKISKINPQVTFSIAIAGLLILPMIFPNVSMGKTLNPIITPDAVNDLEGMRGQLPSDDSLIYAEHGLEYWVSHFTKYECQKLSIDKHQIDDAFELLDGNDYDTLMLTSVHDNFIPIIQEGSGPFVADSFVLITPINDSVQAHPAPVKCITGPTSTTFQIRYSLYDYFTKGMISDHDLNHYVLMSGETEWNFTLPTDIPPITYLLEIEAHSTVGPSQTMVEKINVVFHFNEPAFKTVYAGKEFALVEANSNYTPAPAVPLADPPQNPGEDPNAGKTTYGFLTFPLLIRFPFLTSYLHYFVVIPITLVYWTLLLFGSYRIIRLTINVVKKKVRKEETE